MNETDSFPSLAGEVYSRLGAKYNVLPASIDIAIQHYIKQIQRDPSAKFLVEQFMASLGPGDGGVLKRDSGRHATTREFLFFVTKYVLNDDNFVMTEDGEFYLSSEAFGTEFKKSPEYLKALENSPVPAFGDKRYVLSSVRDPFAEERYLIEEAEAMRLLCEDEEDLIKDPPPKKRRDVNLSEITEEDGYKEPPLDFSPLKPGMAKNPNLVRYYYEKDKPQALSRADSSLTDSELPSSSADPGQSRSLSISPEIAPQILDADTQAQDIASLVSEIPKINLGDAFIALFATNEITRVNAVRLEGFSDADLLTEMLRRNVINGLKLLNDNQNQ